MNKAIFPGEFGSVTAPISVANLGRARLPMTRFGFKGMRDARRVPLHAGARALPGIKGLRSTRASRVAVGALADRSLRDSRRSNLFSGMPAGVAQTSKSAVSRISKSACRNTTCRLGSLRHSGFGNLRYKNQFIGSLLPTFNCL